MDANLIQYLPDWFRQIKDYQYLMQSETGQFEILAALIDAVHQNFYVSTADEGTISDWENLLHIIPNTQMETQDFRRARIINRLSYNPPFTLPYLYNRLNLLIGLGKWAVTVDYGNYTLYVEAAAENQAWAGEVLATINTIKPCHIVYTSRPLLPAALQMSETVSLSKAVYNYRLAYWGLGQLPFTNHEDLGVVVTADQGTIQSALLNSVASYTASDVAKARINGSVEITDFLAKEASGDTATVSYAVTAAQASTITQVELLNAAGDVLEKAPVYIPVSDPVNITHRIPVKEGMA